MRGLFLLHLLFGQAAQRTELIVAAQLGSWQIQLYQLMVFHLRHLHRAWERYCALEVLRECWWGLSLPASPEHRGLCLLLSLGLLLLHTD